jgi:hypothetical protein
VFVTPRRFDFRSSRATSGAAVTVKTDARRYGVDGFTAYDELTDELTTSVSPSTSIFTVRWR